MSTDSLAIFVTEASKYSDEVIIDRCIDRPGTFDTRFYVTGQTSGRDDHRVIDALESNKRVIVFHRVNGKTDFEYMGKVGDKVEDRHVIAHHPMEVELYTKRNALERHLCGEYEHHLKWKMGALHSLGVDVENIPSSLFHTCFVPFDGERLQF